MIAIASAPPTMAVISNIDKPQPNDFMTSFQTGSPNTVNFPVSSDLGLGTESGPGSGFGSGLGADI
jgi:hypothetical protein